MRHKLPRVNFLLSNYTVTVYAEDTDIVVLLMYYISEEDPKSSHNVYLRRSDTFYDMKRIVSQAEATIIKSILLLRAFGGCDTTSSIFRHGQINILKYDLSLYSNLCFIILILMLTKL